MSIVGRERDLLHFRKHRQKSTLTKRKGGIKKKKKKGFSKITLLNSSATTSCNATSPLTIPCRHHLIPPFLSFLPPPFSHCSLRSLPTLLTKGFLFSHYLLRFVGRTNDIVCVCWKEKRGGGWWFFFSFHFSFRHVQSALLLLLFFFSLFRRSFSLLRSCVFPLFILLQFFDVDNRSGFPITMSIVLVSWRFEASARD